MRKTILAVIWQDLTWFVNGNDENEGKNTVKYATGVGSARNVDLDQEISFNSL